MAAQPLTPEQMAQVAAQVGLPPDAPLGFIQQFMQLLEVNKGKETKEVAEAKKVVKKAIIDYMVAGNHAFLRIRDKYIVLKDELKPISYSDELVAKCFVAFHRQNKAQGTVEQAAMAFIEFIKEVRKRSGERTQELSVAKKPPLAAQFAGLGNMPLL